MPPGRRPGGDAPEARPTRHYSTYLRGSIWSRFAAFQTKYTVETIPIELGFVDGVATSHYRPLADTLRIAWTVTRTRFWG